MTLSVFVSALSVFVFHVVALIGLGSALAVAALLLCFLLWLAVFINALFIHLAVHWLRRRGLLDLDDWDA